MILPALTEAKSPFWRPIKYSLFPPLGLASLAGYLNPDDEVVLQDEHVGGLELGAERVLGPPRARRDLIKPPLYLVPNSIVVSRGCPPHCDFCYKDAFFQGGRSFYTQGVDQALAEIYLLR